VRPFSLAGTAREDQGRSAERRSRATQSRVGEALLEPTIVAFERAGPEGEAALEADLGAAVERNNRAGDRAAVMDAAYLELVAVRA
jgi:hypothetical protein